MNSYKKRLQQHKKLILATAMWLLATIAWWTLHVEAVGGPPLVVVWSSDPGLYDLHQTSNPTAYEVFRHVCEPLFYEDEAGVVHGLLAEDAVQFEDNGQRLTIQLRPNLTFHNGALLDARAVQASFERLQGLGLSPLLTELRNVQVQAQPDGRTVVFGLPQPDYDFVRLVLSNPYASIVAPQTDVNVGEAPGFIACSGPYRFAPELYQPGRALTLIRNAAYRWPPHFFANRAAAHIPQMHFRFEADREQQFQLLQSGATCVLSLSGEQAALAAKRPELKLYAAEGGITYLGFNFLRPRWQDERTRQALAQAVDKAALAAVGPFTPANTPFSTGAIGYNERAAPYGYPYDPAASRQLLAEANFDLEQEIILLIPESQTYRSLAAIVIKQLADVGLRQVRIRETPRSQLLSERQDFDLLLFDYAWGDYTALAIFLGPGPRNLLNYANDDIAQLVRAARLAADAATRAKHTLSAQRLVLEKAVWQPLLLRQLTLAVNTECVTGEQQSVTGELLFHDADTR